MNIDFREMALDEAGLVHRVGKSSFGPMEALFMPKPKHAVLAVGEGEIVGGITYKVFPGRCGKLVGWAETAFVTKAHAGKGIGNILYAEATQSLHDRGCETVITMVRDDNVASWKAFENTGYNRLTYTQMLQQLGLLRFLWFWLASMNCMAVGHDLCATVPAKQSTTPRQAGLYFLLTMVTLLPALRFGSSFDAFGSSVIAILALQIAAVMGGAVATVVSGRKWHFRVTRGGLLIALAVAAFGGVFPMIGRFYPEQYQRTPAFRCAMGLEGLLEWSAVLLLVIIAFLLRETSVIWTAIQSFGGSILLYHAIALFPFGSYGGTRIWDWSKCLSLILLLGSCVLMFVL